MDSLAETVTVGDHELVLGGWYVHPDLPYGRRGQVGYTASGDLKLLVYRSGLGGLEPWVWVEFEDFDLDKLVQIER